MTDHKAFEDCRRIEYRRLMTRLSDLVGRHQLPVNPDAADINDILDGDPVHCDLARQVVRSIYRSGRCGHLDAKIRAETVFNSLGDIRARLVADNETDVDQINLLEELGWASRVLFATPPPGAKHQTEPDTIGDDYAVVVRHPAL